MTKDLHIVITSALPIVHWLPSNKENIFTYSLTIYLNLLPFSIHLRTLVPSTRHLFSLFFFHSLLLHTCKYISILYLILSIYFTFKGNQVHSLFSYFISKLCIRSFYFWHSFVHSLVSFIWFPPCFAWVIHTLLLALFLGY